MFKFIFISFVVIKLCLSVRLPWTLAVTKGKGRCLAPALLFSSRSKSPMKRWVPPGKSLSWFLSFFGSVQFSRSVVSNSLRPHESQHTRPPVHHHLPEFTQTHVHQVGNAIQPSHPLLSPFPPAPNPSQHQSLFQWVNSSHEVAKVMEFWL